MEPDAEAEKLQGNIAFEAGEYEEALRRYNAAIKLSPESHILYSNRSAAFFRLNQFDAALQDAEASVSLSEGLFGHSFDVKLYKMI
jgi:tetratricopeptide (TPR) repeat protein